MWRREPSEARREELTRRLAEYDEELTYWAETIKEAERRGFKVWGRADFVKGDFVQWRGSWYEVTRVNAKTVTVPHIHAAFDGGTVGAVGGCRVVTRAATAETRHKSSTYTLPYNEASGRMSAEQMRAALAGEAIPADPRDVTPEPAPEAAEAERAAEHQDQAAPAPVAPAAMVSAPAPAGVSDPGTAEAWEADGGAVPGVAVPRAVAQFRGLDANASKSGSAPGGEGGFSRELDAHTSSEASGGGTPVPSAPVTVTVDRTGWTWQEYGDDWTCDDDCRVCATGARCEDCRDCTQFAAPYPSHWATLEREGGPARMLDICHGPGGMAEGRRLALADSGDASAEVDAVGVEINPGAAATATAAGHRVIVTDVRALDPGHPVLRRVRKIHFSTPCPTFSKGGKHSGVQPAEVSAFMDVLFYASEALGWLEVDDVCSHYGGPHGYFGGEELDEWDPADYDGEIVNRDGWTYTEHCESGYVPASCTPDEFRQMAREAVSDERTALMAEVLLWPMVMIRNGGVLETVTMEQSDNLLKRAPGLCEAIQEELQSAGFAWVSFQIEDAAHYGAASNRVRAWMVASLHEMLEGAQWGTGAEQAAKVWGKNRPTWGPDLSTWVDFYGGRTPLPRVTMAQALGWEEGWWIDTRGARPVDPVTGRAKGGGSFSADKAAQCVTATWYGATRRRADEPQGCASGGRAFTQAELGGLVGFRWDYPWQHVGRGEGIRNKAQQAADAVSPFMGMAVTGAVFSRARRKWYRRAMVYQRALYRYAFAVWANDQRAAITDRLASEETGTPDSPRTADVNTAKVQTPPMLPAAPVRLMLERGPDRSPVPAPRTPTGRAEREPGERVTLDGRAARTAAARPKACRGPVAVPVRAMLATAPAAGGAAPREPHSAAAAAPVGGPLSGPAEARGNGGVPAGHSTRQGATRQATRQGVRQPAEAGFGSRAPPYRPRAVPGRRHTRPIPELDRSTSKYDTPPSDRGPPSPLNLTGARQACGGGATPNPPTTAPRCGTVPT